MSSFKLDGLESRPRGCLSHSRQETEETKVGLSDIFNTLITIRDGNTRACVE